MAALPHQSFLRSPVRFNATAATPAAAADAVSSLRSSQLQVGAWMLGCTSLIFGAVVLGGVTRLTESGLSMTKWHPIKGMKAPTTQAEWEAEFEHYKQFPEYKYSVGMTLEDFKQIFFMEYAHRMWGRLIGMAFILPGAYFALKKKIQPQLRPVVLAIGGLIGFQGVLGWLMVKSGLDYDPQGKHAPRVSQYRLAAHLGSAFVLYVMTLYTGLLHVLPAQPLQGDLKRLRTFRKLAHGIAGLVFVTAISGAFVAGMDAGLIYNEFPFMGESLVPTDINVLQPIWKNVFENPATAQFDHRVLGTSTGLAVAGLWAYARKLSLPPRARIATHAMLGMVAVQITLGISTLLYFVPTPLAATHQAGSLGLLTFATWLLYELRAVPK
ncbi:uncharacterized protein MONBRDRAFT_14857 [Monosiga brevicollis MX1]|uniref:Uncharacterized protein n=1 Tax=Monosiga brevicollis TaxID=81824 RepID=A9USM5_MONBE|nr:uncharacterized protein MONBRDRAFT_14857 [Monosiga brevicollis MX1]EDQ92128.1 predicted protein [Monosiga brevicollis MX1]|eukprot:XP_001743414.1 hypothetical protein [Monosiga brevicollis MX1]